MRVACAPRVTGTATDHSVAVRNMRADRFGRSALAIRSAAHGGRDMLRAFGAPRETFSGCLPSNARRRAPFGAGFVIINQSSPIIRFF